MAFELGGPGGPGRPLGKSKLQVLLERIGRPTYEPMANLIKYYHEVDCPRQRKNEIDELLLPYFHPKLKQIEYTDGEGNSLLPSIIQVVMPKKKDDEKE